VAEYISQFYEVAAAGPASGSPAVTVVGHISRTRFSDRDLLVEALEVLWDAQPGLFVTVHGAHGFDTMVLGSISAMGVPVLSAAPEDWKARFGWRTRSVELLRDSWALLVLTRLKKKQEVWEVDPGVVEAAVNLDVPVFSLDEEGVMRTWP
jgi:hypothetical protein